MIRIYTYKNCDTCRKATRWLKTQSIEFEEIPIREQPPTLAELKRMLAYYEGEVKRLFNTSGRDYREMKLKEKMGTLTEDALLALLEANGNLVKRPFLLGADCGVVGFDEAKWKALNL